MRAQHPIGSGGGGGSEQALLHDLAHHVAPRLLPYAMSFLTLGIFWVGQAIGLLVALQLNSVIAPRIGILDRA